MKKLLQNLRQRLRGAPQPSPMLELAGIPEADLRIIDCVQPYTMTGWQRIHALIEATRYCVRRRVPGALAECGVWRGGSVLAMLLTLQEMGVSDRDVWLYDTFEGMTEPTEKDVSAFEDPALKSWRESQARRERPWGQLFHPELFNEEGVRAMLYSTGYPRERLHFIKGPVEQTVPAQMPQSFALLRLDTDWYESTRHELLHMYPRLARAGVLIIDDYGHWDGCRRAVDEYFAAEAEAPLLCRIDYTARLAVKS